MMVGLIIFDPTHMFSLKTSTGVRVSIDALGGIKVSSQQA